jgi:hypothetical protein
MGDGEVPVAGTMDHQDELRSVVGRRPRRTLYVRRSLVCELVPTAEGDHHLEVHLPGIGPVGEVPADAHPALSRLVADAATRGERVRCSGRIHAEWCDPHLGRARFYEAQLVLLLDHDLPTATPLAS